ncbi:DNA/RNA non-specific endonuclease [Nocardia asteroides]|uniref:DNA/RNA non-specific endonuclease n=1 Tax=Nocardia asteroides TaxID=1824 RepID=UPI00343E1107
MTAGQDTPPQIAGDQLLADFGTLAGPAVDAPAAEAIVARGYDPDFLGTRIGIPELDAAIEDDAVRLDGSPRIDYTHFSLALSRSRRFAFWVAWNIDGAAMKRVGRVGIEFVKDPRLPADAQVGNELYLRNRLDRGHLARRADLLWGSISEAEQANADSFFYTNITPQLDDFNQSSRHGVWGELENAVFADVDIDDLKVSVFGGPVFRADDRVHRDVALPREYWKVICFVERNRLRAKAFLLTQHVEQLEALELDEFRVFQVPLSDIEARARLRFPAPLRAAETAATTESTEQYIPLETTADIVW